jgi:hypothetical protein
MANQTHPVSVKECAMWASSQAGWKHQGTGAMHDKECNACAFERLLAHNIRMIINDKMEKIALNLEAQAKEIDATKSPMHEWQKMFVGQMGKAMRTLKESPPVA